MPTLNHPHVLLSKKLWINNLCLNPESVACVVGLCDLIGPVTGVDADSSQSFGYNMACKVQQKKITKNLSGTAISSRQSSLAACVQAASTSYSPADYESTQVSWNLPKRGSPNELPLCQSSRFCSYLVGKKKMGLWARCDAKTANCDTGRLLAWVRAANLYTRHA